MTLSVQSLRYSVGKRTLIHSFTHSFETGKVYGLLGLNGSGKTTLLKLLAGIWTETSGKLLWNENELAKLSRLERSQLMTFVPNSPPLYFDYTVRDIIAMGAYANRPKNLEQLLDSAIQTVDLTPLQDRLITNISSGERQRAYIARALVTESPILLLDEPTASLDIKQSAAIWELILHLRNEGKLLVIATHDLVRAHELTDEILTIENGYTKKSSVNF